MRITDTHIYFWGDDDFLSNFYPSLFTINNYNYRFNEEFIMIQKALLFEDHEIVDKIIKETTPYNIKQLGRKVKNFNEKVWLENRDRILYIGLMEKFKQNKDLKKLLLKTKNRHLVEASKYDKIYGVGLEESDDRILDESQWLGENLLGNILMEVRKNINN